MDESIATTDTVETSQVTPDEALEVSVDEEEEVSPWYSGDDDDNDDTDTGSVLNEISEAVDEPEPELSEEDKLVATMEVAEELETVSQAILDSDYVEEFQEAISCCPEDFVKEMGEDPKLLKALSVDIESGLYKHIAPHLDSVMAQGKTFKEAYGFIYGAIAKKEEARKSADEKRELLKAEPATNSKIESKRPQDMNEAEFDAYWDAM